jgi:hypothetical protein
MKNELAKIILGISAFGLVVVAGFKGYEKSITIKPEQCETWVKANTHEKKGGLWDFYMAENIFQTEKNWAIYQKMTSEKNNGKAKGKILLPDLDNNGYVGAR